MTEAQNAGKRFDELVGILGTLRGPGGCPWDRARTPLEIRDYFIEEVYEAVEALEAGDAAGLAEELGDVLMEIVFLSRLFEERGAFTVADALERVNAKMIARHPHVFGSPRDMDAAGVAGAWQEGKRAEKGAPSVLEDPGPATPALFAAFQIGRKVSAFGIDLFAGALARLPSRGREAGLRVMPERTPAPALPGPGLGSPAPALLGPGSRGVAPDLASILAEIREVTGDLEAAVSDTNAAGIEEELGDLMFSLANLSRKLGVNPEIALRKANVKFARRFRTLEDELRSSGKELGKASLEDMESIWDRLEALDRP